MEKIFWTPEGSQAGIGMVEMTRPTKPLTMTEYRWLLERKIRTLIQATPPLEAQRLFRESVEVQEKLTVPAKVEQMAELLAWESETLFERSGMSTQEWPVQPSQINTTPQDLDLMPEDLRDEPSLTDFLGHLYHGM